MIEKSKMMSRAIDYEKDFSDHNTLIYGHNTKNGTMFHDLHEFAEETFFEEHRYIFIYTPEEYGSSGNFRSGVEVTSENHIVTLSTCVDGESDKRFLVQGVLVGFDGTE